MEAGAEQGLQPRAQQRYDSQQKAGIDDRVWPAAHSPYILGRV